MITYGILAGKFQPFHAGHYEAYLQMCKYFGKDNVFVITNNKSDDENPLTVGDKLEILKHFDIPESNFFVSTGPFRPLDFFAEKMGKNSKSCFVLASYSERCLDLLKKTSKKFPEDPKALERYDLDKKTGIYYIEVSTGNYKIDSINVFDGLSLETKEDNQKKYLLYLYVSENQSLFELIKNRFGGRMASQRRDFDDPRYKAWRNSVFIRDNYTCQATGVKGKIQAHHIERWVDRPDLRYDVNNGITLSEDFHKTITGKEDQYAEMFKDIVRKRLREINKNSKKMDNAKVVNNKAKIHKRVWIPKSPYTR